MLREAMRAAERAYLLKVLTQAKGNMVHAARMAGVARSTLFRHLAKHNINFLKQGRQGRRASNRGTGQNLNA